MGELDVPYTVKPCIKGILVLLRMTLYYRGDHSAWSSLRMNCYLYTLIAKIFVEHGTNIYARASSFFCICNSSYIQVNYSF
jgi:hypothetical protein